MRQPPAKPAASRGESAQIALTQFTDMSQLRGALTSDSPDIRAEAYQAVLEAEVKPSAVLGSRVDDSVQSTLVEAEVIPPRAGEGTPQSARLERIEELLQQLVEQTGGE